MRYLRNKRRTKKLFTRTYRIFRQRGMSLKLVKFNTKIFKKLPMTFSVTAKPTLALQKPHYMTLVKQRDFRFFYG